jgi:peptidoglycan/xylan/chitin deacetylase (PgdA/CDA1 family)
MPLRRVQASALLAAVLVMLLASCTGERRESNLSKSGQHPSHPPTQAVAQAPSAGAPAPLKPAAGGPVAGGPPAAGLPATAIFTAGVIAKTTSTDAVALTFDDGPDNQTMAILNLLRSYGVKATFCLIGSNVREHPELVQAIVRDGHSLCNHTWIHDLDLGQRSAEEIRSDLQRTNDEIHKAVPGVAINYFRHPGGNWTPTAVTVAQEMGMTSIDWDTDPFDWDTTDYGVGPTMINHIVDTVKQGVQPGSIVLSHDGGGDRTSTVAAYETLLPYLLQERHLRLVPLPTGERVQQSTQQKGQPPK